MRTLAVIKPHTPTQHAAQHNAEQQAAQAGTGPVASVPAAATADAFFSSTYDHCAAAARWLFCSEQQQQQQQQQQQWSSKQVWPIQDPHHAQQEQC
jgi:hypothetical protein